MGQLEFIAFWACILVQVLYGMGEEEGVEGLARAGEMPSVLQLLRGAVRRRHLFDRALSSRWRWPPQPLINSAGYCSATATAAAAPVSLCIPETRVTALHNGFRVASEDSSLSTTTVCSFCFYRNGSVCWTLCC
ncbi:unnamed protein product [Gongylonema pulchrum]|uniref:Secreted protein n=1 Tax=Gongylonema pulchrum TaxID=637853 RepID=A0A183EA89_9BILA|nr:unnamed protein product [Gongylonema pulchrum]